MNKFEITRRKDGEFQFTLKATNGEILLNSEGYTTKENCKKGIESVKKNSLIDERYDRKISTNNKPYFNLKASNGEVIATSPLYENEEDREKNIELVRKKAHEAEIVDLSLASKGGDANHKQTESKTSKVVHKVAASPTKDSDTVKASTKKIALTNVNIKDAEEVEEEEYIRPLSAPANRISDNRKMDDDSLSVATKKPCWCWLKYLLLALAILAILFFAWRSCNKKVADMPEVIGIEEQEFTTIIDRTPVELVLPNGKQLHAYKGGIEDQLITFLQSDGYKNATNDELKEKWFNFDNIDFKFGSATELIDGSDVQLQNVVEILKNFSDVKVKVGAYTDKVGGEAANMKLSNERAKTIKTAFEKAGIGKQIVEIEGYGDKFATRSADAPDSERALDRKIALRLIK